MLVKAVINEIELMRQLMKHVHENQLPDVIVELVDAEVKEEEQVVFIVMECGEIDLAHILQRRQSTNGEGGGINENFICMYWQQMLLAVDVIHKAKVIHGDLKPANFLCVRGALKLIDFGIANEMNADSTKIERDSQASCILLIAMHSLQSLCLRGRLL